MAFASILNSIFLFRGRSEIGESANKYQLLGLNLLFLLSQNRVSEFHTELELLPQEIIQSNEFIRHPLALEQYLMEGSYQKIFGAKVVIELHSHKPFSRCVLIESMLILFTGSRAIAELQRFHGSTIGNGT